MPSVQVGAKDVLVVQTWNNESQHETLTEQETFKDDVLKTICKACVYAGLDIEAKIPVLDTTWTIGRVGIILEKLNKRKWESLEVQGDAKSHSKKVEIQYLKYKLTIYLTFLKQNNIRYVSWA